MFGGRERIRPCCSRCGDTERERMWWMGVLCCSGTSRVDVGSCFLSLPRPSAAELRKHIHRDGNTVYQMDVWYWNIDELTALNIQLIYVHVLSLHSLAWINSGAEFELLLCSIKARILLWGLWIYLWSNNLVYFYWCWQLQQQKLYSLIGNQRTWICENKNTSDQPW